MNLKPVSAPSFIPVRSTAFIGCGRVATTLALAMQGAGWPVVGLASRDPVHAEALAMQMQRPELVDDMQAVVDRADLIMLTVSDDAIARVTDALSWRAGQQVVHCSGATELSAMGRATQHGARVGGFHPLQIFSDPLLALERLAGSSVAVEASDATLKATLHGLSQTLGLRVLDVPAGGRARYHAAAGYAASGLLSVLEEARRLWASLGWDEQAVMDALLPLSLNTLHVAAARGLSAAVSGPLARADTGVVARQREDLARWDPQALLFYDALAQRQLLALERGQRLDATAMVRIRGVLSEPPSDGGLQSN